MNDEEIAEALARAARLTDGIKEDSLRPHAFSAILASLLSSHTPTALTPLNHSVGATSRITGTDQALLARIASESGAAINDLAELFYVENDEPRIAVPARKLGSSLREQQERVAYLIAGARFYGLDEADVPFEHVRNELTRLKCLDSKNFATYMRDLPGVVVVGDRQKSLRPRPSMAEYFISAVSASR